MNYKTRSFVLLALIGFSLISCQNKTTKSKVLPEVKLPEIQYPVTIDFVNNFEKYRELKLSEIADSIEYVKLENSPKCFIKRVKSVHITDSFIFVPQYKTILQFDRQGKFIRHIGKMGRGPKEYSHVYDACVNRDKQRMYVNAGESHKIQIYDFEGNHKAKFKYFSNIAFEMLDSSKVVSSIENPYGQERLKLLITGPEMDTLETLLNTVKFPFQKRTSVYSHHFDNRFYRWDNALHYKKLYGDTVFQVKALGNIEARYVIDEGKYKLPVDCRIERIQDFSKFKIRANKYIKTWVHEIKDYVLISYNKANYGGLFKLAVYDKRSGELYSIGNPDEKNNGFANDLDHSGHYFPLDVQDNRYMVTSFPAISLYDENQERLDNIKKGKENLNYGLKYLEFMKSVKMDDNLIVQIVHLK